MGLAGAAAALMGAQVTFTDLPSVVPLLRLNVHANLSPAALQRESCFLCGGQGREGSGCPVVGESGGGARTSDRAQRRRPRWGCWQEPCSAAVPPRPARRSNPLDDRRHGPSPSPRPHAVAGAEFGQARGAAPPSVCELDWADAGARDALKPAFDFLLAADCVYSEAAVPAFLDCLAALSSPRSRILVANEFRCARVHEAFELGCKPTFVLRRVPATRLHPDYRHPAIHVYALTRRGASAGL